MLTKVIIHFVLKLFCLSYVLGNVLVNENEDGKQNHAIEDIQNIGDMERIQCVLNKNSDQNARDNLVDYMDCKFNALQRMVIDLTNNVKGLKLVTSEVIPVIEKNINEKVTSILKNFPETKEDINRELNELENRIDSKLEYNTNRTLDELKKIPEVTEKLNAKLSELEIKTSKLEENLKKSQRLDNIMNVTEKIVFSTNLVEHKLNMLQNNILILDTDMRTRLNTIGNSIRSGCKEYLAHGYRYEYMPEIDGLTFDHAILRKKGNDVTYFETHIAIKSDMNGIILLSPVPNPGKNDLVFEFGVGISNNKFTVLRTTIDSSDEVARVSTPNILSKSTYTKFYIKISEGILSIGKERDSPLIACLDSRVSTIKYIGISSWGSGSAKFLYDCPADV